MHLARGTCPCSAAIFTLRAEDGVDPDLFTRQCSACARRTAPLARDRLRNSMCRDPRVKPVARAR